MEAQKALDIQSNPYKKKCQKPDLKHGVIVIKMAWYCHKRHANQYKRQEDPGTNLRNASHLTFDKDIKNGYWKKDRLLN